MTHHEDRAVTTGDARAEVPPAAATPARTADAAGEAELPASEGEQGGAAPHAPGGGRAGRTRRLLRRRSLPYLLIVPALVFELLVHIIPMVTGVAISFFRLNEFHFRNWLEAPFVALRNFRVALDPSGPIGSGLLHSLGITVAFTVIAIAGCWLLGIAGALALNEQRHFRGTLLAVLLVPYALPVYVAVINWRFILQQDGAFNSLLAAANLVDEPPFWLFGGNAFWSMVMTAVWRSWPFALLILFAGLQSIPPELYHAASVDGASPWRKFRHITLPLLRPVNSVLLLVLFLWTFNDFNVPFVLFGKTPTSSADLLPLHIYVNTFENFNYGLGAAMSVLLLLFLMVVCAIYVRAFRVGGGRDA